LIVYYLRQNLTKYDNVRFEYDTSGVRQRKTSTGPEPWSRTNTEYHWSDGRLLAERRILSRNDIELHDGIKEEHERLINTNSTYAYSYGSATDISYIQGVDGTIGFTVKHSNSENTYYYRKNIQGDVTHITDPNGNVVAEYVYDAFGNHNIITDIDGIGSLNAIRYRGYYFDDETGLYHLSTRYYDPETGRFINADEITILDESRDNINGLNLYAYCSNNPIMFVDPSGQFFGIFEKIANAVGDIANVAVNWVQDHWKEVVIGVAFIILGAVVTALTAGVGIGFMAALGSALLSSTIQVGISMAISVAISGIISVANGGGFFDNVGDSLASGFMWGGIFAGGAQIVGSGFRTAANLGVKTGRNGGISLGKSGANMFSADKNNWTKAGGTLIKLGKNTHLDIGAHWGLHLHTALNSAKWLPNILKHFPIGAVIAGIKGGT